MIPAACRRSPTTLPPDPIADFGGYATSPWSQTQINAFQSVLQLYENVANVDFVQVSDPSQADDIERLTDSNHPYLGRQPRPP